MDRTEMESRLKGADDMIRVFTIAMSRAGAMAKNPTNDEDMAHLRKILLELKDILRQGYEKKVAT
jgi:hypothetical protein